MLWEKGIFSMKKLFEEENQGVTYRETYFEQKQKLHLTLLRNVCPYLVYTKK